MTLPIPKNTAEDLRLALVKGDSAKGDILGSFQSKNPCEWVIPIDTHL